MARSGTRGGGSQAPRDQPKEEPRQRQQQTTRSSTKKGKSIASSSTAIPEREPRSTTYPWPREDDTPFSSPEWRTPLIPELTLKDIQKTTGYQNYRHGDPWTHHHCIFYNGLHRIEVTPTRFVCHRTLRKMGIEDDVRHMLQRMGLGNIAYQTYPLYPELVRQFLASVELRFEDGAIPVASEGTLSFFSSGILYEISIPTLCTLYGFDQTAELCRFPSDFDQAAELWNLIGPGQYESRGAKLTHIRNPVIRIVAKILGNILFGKDESGALRKDELMLIHFGLPSFVSSIYTSPPPSALRTNLGAIFAEILVQKKTRGLNTVNRKWERIGSLLTPIFRHCEIELGSTLHVPQIALFDEQYFRNSGILKPGFVYQFQDRAGVSQRCQLPLRDFTYLTSLESIEFSLAPEFLQPHPSAPRRRGSSSRASTSQPHLEDDRVPGVQFPPHSQSADDMEFILPPYTGEYAPPPPPAETTETERWMIESQLRAHSMMERIWGALARIRCPPPPPCFRATETREDRERTAPTTDVPDVAGHRTTDTEDADDLSDPETRLARRRRRPGQSQSGSSDDH